MNFRKNIIPALEPYFEKDEKLFLLYGDMGFGGVESLQEKYSDRVLNCGIMEQGMVGIAAGMAMAGWKPIVYTMCNFLCYRALEQIRNDVMLQNLNVKFIGTGANDHFSFLGKSHTCDDDDIEILQMIGLKTFDTYRLGYHGGRWYNYLSIITFNHDFFEWILSDKAGYIRV